jgi:hypothetical protein
MYKIVEQGKTGFLLIESFKHAFLAFKDLAFRAAPCVRQLLKRDSRGDPLRFISLCRIVDIVAFKTYPAGEFYRLLCHLATSSVLFYPSTLSDMNSPVEASEDPYPGVFSILFPD